MIHGGYDLNGNQTTINAPLTRNTTNQYDALNRLKQVTDPASGITQFAYTANDDLMSVTDPRTKVTSWTSPDFRDIEVRRKFGGPDAAPDRSYICSWTH